MKLGIFSKTFPGVDPDAVLQQCRKAGFESVQYNWACAGLPSLPTEISREDIERTSNATTKNNISIDAVSATFNMIHPNPTVREKGLASLQLIAAAARSIGTSLVTLCTGTRNPENQWVGHPENSSTEAWADLCTSMEKAIEIAEKYDVYLGVEPELANVIDSAARAARLIDEMKSPRLRVVFDPANLFDETTVGERDQIIESSIEQVAGNIAMAHAKDRALDGSFRAAGTGCVDFSNFLSMLVAAGFNGSLVTHGCTEDEAKMVAVFLRSKLDDVIK